VLISGFVSPSLARSVQPPSLVPWLEERGYMIDVDLALGHSDLEAFWSELVAHHAARERVLLALLAQERCDLLFAAFTGTDRLHHFLWEQMERGEEPWASRFHSYYDLIDQSVGALVERLPGDCSLLLCSDHGFCRLDEEIYVNRWLERDGWLELEEPARSIASIVPASTRAYCMDPGRLYLNLEGREPGGIVPQSAYAEVRDELESWAQGLPFVSEVVRREDAFSGPFAERGPDLVLVSHDGSDLRGAMRNPGLTGKGALTGMHTRDNAFVLLAGRRAEGVADVQDVAATTLAALGLDPTPLDGRVLGE
jgi:predicted AlkP superfamily phosphohydrolase/phosphomutase